MQATAEKTVREIAVETPSSVRVFESLGIDYCCGGGLSLPDACARANVSLSRALALLEEAGRDNSAAAPVDWSAKSLAQVIDHIVNAHHVFVRTESPRLQALAAKVAGKHGPAHSELSQIELLFSELAQELRTHLMKEEQILFPYVVAMEQSVLTGSSLPSSCFGTVTHPIAMMIAEHDGAGDILAQLRRLSNGFIPPPDACVSYAALYAGLAAFEADLHRHIHLENNILFPRAVDMERAL